MAPNRESCPRSGAGVAFDAVLMLPRQLHPGPRAVPSSLSMATVAFAQAFAARPSLPSELPAEPDEDTHSPGALYVSTASPIGALIGLLALLIPLGCVLGDRFTLPGPEASLSTTISDGYQQSGRLSSTRTGESGGGDPGRQPEQIRIQP